MSTPSLPSLDGRRFRGLTAADGAEVGPGTTFTYHERDAEIWAEYAGGAVVRGFLVGSRQDDTVEFRYCQLNVDGQTSTGHCVSRLTRADSGLLRLEESWEWESRPGSGTSVVEELRA